MKKILALFMILGAMGFFTLNYATEKIVTNKAEAAAVKQVQAAHILVPTEQEAVNIRKEIMDGSSDDTFNRFMEAAKKYSKCPSGKSGGILGWFGRGDMVPEFENAAFNLPTGIVSEPVKTQFGYHLIYVISKK